ncbi:MAG: tRNA uracil 4-sulfurtransferase ThiI [Parcubacteria group bacterium]
MTLFTSTIIHYDEIGLKGKNRVFFVDKLISNVRVALGSGVVVKNGASKIIVESAVNVERLALIPGIANFNPAILVDTDIDKVKETAVAIWNCYKPKTFKIETTRVDKTFPLNSPQISREVGGYIFENAGAAVDVHNPELTIKVEMEKGKSFVLGQTIQGVGGLPVGTAGKAVCLLSGGIDSPVAAFEMMKRGAEVIFVHFHNQTINKAGVENKIRRLVERLSIIQPNPTLYIIPFAELQQQVIANVPSDVRMIVYRRLMFKIAERIAKKHGALALVTGDSLGQVASQTMENLSVIYQATDMLKLTPLISMNKSEITDIAHKIGTYEISIEPYEDCCSLLIAKHPETRGDLRDILKAEEVLDVDGLIARALTEI